MLNSILIAYATRYGSTQEVAEAIAATLHERGLEVELQPVRKVRTLEGYGAVVLGAPLYMFHWHKDALRFISQHRKPSQSSLWQFSPLAHLVMMRRSGRTYAHSSIKSWPSFPGLHPPLLIYLAVSSTRRICASPGVSCRPSNRCQPATYGTGRQFAPGQAIWPRNFSLIYHNKEE